MGEGPSGSVPSESRGGAVHQPREVGEVVHGLGESLLEHVPAVRVVDINYFGPVSTARRGEVGASGAEAVATFSQLGRAGAALSGEALDNLDQPQVVVEHIVFAAGRLLRLARSGRLERVHVAYAAAFRAAATATDAEGFGDDGGMVKEVRAALSRGPIQRRSNL